MVKMLKMRIDFYPLMLVLLVFGGQVFLYLSNTYIHTYMIFLLFIAQLQFCATFSHHQQHCNIFYHYALNRLFEMVMALQTHITPFGWVLHHNLGHHRNYLRQPPEQDFDESCWKRKDGSVMGCWEYTLHNYFYCFDRVRAVGKKYPLIFAKYQWYRAVYRLMCLALFIWHPLHFVMVFFIPARLCLFFCIMVTYYHHAGLDSQDPFQASYSSLSKWWNWFSFNLGYHTAHHLKPGLHWSKLPQLHAEIVERIPAHLLK